MHGAIKNIFLSSPVDENERGGFENLNTDVIVQFESGDQYVANFLSYNGLEGLVQDHRSSVDVASDDHYQLLNVVLVNDTTGRDLRRVVEHMLTEGDFQIAFRKL